jgi:hypothetical protein
MARKFGPQHMKSGYAAMGGNMKKPVFKHANRASKQAGQVRSKK